MKLPLDQRTALADSILSHIWPCEYWSREEQLFANAEGWNLTVFGAAERIERCDYIQEFATDQDAIAYVLQRAQEGSPLHCRAVILHGASVLKHGGI